MYSDYRDFSGGNPLATTFSTGSYSKIISSSPSAGLLTVINTTAYPVAVVLGNYNDGTTAPSSSLPGKCLIVPAAPTGGSGVAAYDMCKVTKGDSIFVRTLNGSAVTSGSVYISIK